MLIRPAKPADFPAIAAITNHFIVHTAIHFGYDPVTPDELRAGWEKTREKYPFLVAEAPVSEGDAPAIAGFAKVTAWRDRDAYQWTAEPGIYIDPRFHRRGIGRALYIALIDACRDRGFHTLVAGITLPNDASVKLHEAVGFRKIAHNTQVGWKFDRWHDTGFWQLMLRDEAHKAQPLKPPSQ